MLLLGTSEIVVETPKFPTVEAVVPSVTGGVIVPVPGAPGPPGESAGTPVLLLEAGVADVPDGAAFPAIVFRKLPGS